SQVALESAAAAVLLMQVGGECGGEMEPRDPLRRHVRNSRGHCVVMVAAEPDPSDVPAYPHEAVILPAIFEIPGSLEPRGCVAHVESRVRKWLPANVVVERTIALELHLILVLLGALHVVVSRSVLLHWLDRELEF